MSARASGLLKRTLGCVGHLLEFCTIPGWDWHGPRKGSVPASFRARLLEIVEYNGKRIGGIARVEASRHQFDGWYVQFSLRHVGTYDFVGKCGAYCISLSRHPPAENEPRWCCVYSEVIGWVAPIQCTDESHTHDSNSVDIV